ncbi:hypothetical protein [Acaryochloris marina]|uniref:hypothetical protein n=1 Tax=Acaryochloris marina TaxID=155978 RepID=UPI0021C44BD3|nr:hypothetical protein [Acaryochloris marina]
MPPLCLLLLRLCQHLLPPSNCSAFAHVMAMAHQNQLYRMPMDEELRQDDRILHHINELIHRINEANRMGINFNGSITVN